MDKKNKGENGFIVDVSNARKASEIIYELSNILNMPDAQSQSICLKLGEIDLTVSQLKSIKALVECMNSKIKSVSAVSPETTASANELNIRVAEIENKVCTPEFNEQKAGDELEKALDRIFGDDYFSTYEYEEAPKTDAEPVNEEIPEINLPEISLEKEIKIALNEHVPDKDEYQQSAKTKIILDEEGNDITEEVKKNIRMTEKLPTLYIQRNIRSGQSITSDGNIVVIGSAHPGSEIIAKGDITVWGILGGIARAGSEGNRYARIRALKMHAIQLKIADVFARRPDSSNAAYIQKSDSYIPEEASIKDSRIVIQKLHEEL
ncbi:MAG: hypothetical protein LBK53_00980 [Heliobacteriaceae bacterium]|jgi:septum site-determining protein MinC|nr:hypothetical protein [Heliobacteriaceae bacterium]